MKTRTENLEENRFQKIAEEAEWKRTKFGAKRSRTRTLMYTEYDSLLEQYVKLKSYNSDHATKLIARMNDLSVILSR